MESYARGGSHVCSAWRKGKGQTIGQYLTEWRSKLEEGDHTEMFAWVAVANDLARENKKMRKEMLAALDRLPKRSEASTAPAPGPDPVHTSRVEFAHTMGRFRGHGFSTGCFRLGP